MMDGSGLQEMRYVVQGPLLHRMMKADIAIVEGGVRRRMEEKRGREMVERQGDRYGNRVMTVPHEDNHLALRPH